MSAGGAPTRATVFGGDELGRALCAWVARELAAYDDVEERVSRTQVAWRTPRRGFAYAWDRRWQRSAHAGPVLSVATTRRIDSPRFKEVVEPRPGLWQHHLVVTSLDQLDDEVRGWLADAHAAASRDQA